MLAANCTNRIKPNMLRDVKTEALLVFIRTTLEQTFHQIDVEGFQYKLGTDEDNEFIYLALRELLSQLQECVVNSTYLQTLIASGHKSQAYKLLLKKEEPLMIYYEAITNGVKQNISNGSLWVPELLVIALLSEWFLEEEKTPHLYPFLLKIDYIGLSSRYDLAKKHLDKDRKSVILDMYNMAADLIDRLKNVRYRVNSNRKKSKRRR